MDDHLVGREGPSAGVPMAIGAGARLAVIGLILMAAVFGGYPTVDGGPDRDFDRLARLLREKKQAQARAEIDALIRRDPSDTDTYYRAIEVCWNHGSSNLAGRAALLLLERTSGQKLDREPSDAQLAGLYLTVAMWRQDCDPRGAERFYRAALARDPDNPQLLNALGYFYADRGIKLDQALKLTARAARLVPDDGAVVDSLGWAQYKLGRYREALSTLERAVRLAPDQAELRYHLGAAYAKRGRRHAARVETSKALLLDPHQSGATKLLKTLHN